MRQAASQRLGCAIAAMLMFCAPGGVLAKPRTVEFTRSVFRMEEGTAWAHVSGGVNCDVDYEQLHWVRDKSEIRTERLGAVFHQALIDIGAAPEDENLFERSTPAADLQVAAAISDMHANVCEQRGLVGFSGSLSMTVQWQVYDPNLRQLVGKFETHATGQASQVSANGIDALFLAAFRANARDLTSDSGFQKVLKQPASATASSSMAPAGSPISFTPSLASAPKTLPQAIESVVLVQTDDGHGSGFLISSDGYLLTNQHVVGTSQMVRVRWADGTEGPARVLRADKARDIALLKAESVPAKGLALRLALPAPGEQVFAVGAPLYTSLQGTLTRGIVSGNRVIDGMPFIQSDVAVTHGNSGGPLLNEHGEVVGITDLGFTDRGTPVSLNFFIPIGDGLRALSLSAASAPPSPTSTTLLKSKAPRH